MTTPNDLLQAIDRLRTARPALRPALHASAVAIGVTLAGERDAVLKRLDARWDWCDANVGHPAFTDRESSVMDDLATYEAMQGALDNAAEALFGEAA